MINIIIFTKPYLLDDDYLTALENFALTVKTPPWINIVILLKMWKTDSMILNLKNINFFPIKYFYVLIGDKFSTDNQIYFFHNKSYYFASPILNNC